MLNANRHIHPMRDLAVIRPFRAVYRDLMWRWIRNYSTQILTPSKAGLDAFGQCGGFGGKPHAVIRNCVDLAGCRTPFDKTTAGFEH